MNQENLVYAVFKEGVYRHECGGIFTDVEDALAAAELIAEADCDDYHHYAVVPFALNEMTQLGRSAGVLNEAPAIKEVRQAAGRA